VYKALKLIFLQRTSHLQPSPRSCGRGPYRAGRRCADTRGSRVLCSCAPSSGCAA